MGCPSRVRRLGLTTAGLWLCCLPWVMAQPLNPEETTIPTMPVLPEAATPMTDITAQPTGELPTIPIPSVTGTTPPLPTAPTTTVVSPSSTSPIPVGDPDYSLVRRPEIAPGTVPSQRGELAEGTAINLTVFREMTFQPYQAINVNLQVVNPVVDRHGQVVIPAGSTVWGLFEPVYETEAEDEAISKPKRRFIGNRFVANRVTTPNGTYIVQGSTDLIKTQFDPSANLGQVALEGAGYGAAGGLALGILTGGVGFLPILAGTLAGATTGTTNVDQVVALHPNSVVTMELSSPLIVQ
ncbi:MAG: hypothetical protein OHK0012_20210 [Synechococcales cyanobacterium]